MDALLLALVIGMLAVGSLGMLAWRYEAWLLRWARLVALALAAPALLLLFPGDGATGLSLVWFPGSGEIGLRLGAPGIHLAVSAIFGLALANLGRDGRAARSPPGAHGLAFILCGLVVAALTVDHLLARVVLLDMASLATAAVLWLSLDGWRDPRAMVRRYLVFRLGDALFLLMALLLHRGTGSFNIEEAFARAEMLPTGQRLAIVLAGLGAAWIKLGLPPARGWLIESTRLGAPRRFWLPAATLPLLGGYLLYRIGALVLPVFGRGTLVLAGGLAVAWSLFTASRHKQPWRASAEWLGVHGALGLVLLSTPVMRAYLWTFVPARMALCAFLPTEAGQIELTPLPVALERRLARSLRALVRSAAFVERDVLDALVGRLARGVEVAGQALQAQHTGLLRRNLLWASVALAALVGLFVAWWAL